MRRVVRLGVIGFGIVAGVAMGASSAWAGPDMVGPHPGCDDNGFCKPGAPRPHFRQDDDPLGPTLKLFQDCVATGSHSPDPGVWCPGGAIPRGGI